MHARRVEVYGFMVRVVMTLSVTFVTNIKWLSILQLVSAAS